MRRFLVVLVISSVALTGCGRLRDSKVNPINWFGNGKPRPVATAQTGAGTQTNPLIPTKRASIFRKNKTEVYFGTPVDQISSISVENLPSGAIIHVTGISLRQGAHDVRLTSTSKAEPVDGVLTFTLAAVQPQDQPQGAQLARTIHAAQFVSTEDLENTTVIRIVGDRNVVTSKP